ncbi:MAG: undecaprenyl-diphosphate phosphatase [Lachnospiraceae bacterium]|nr:undecaprenyl-diphosphate phosphatase [Lachnospiraceae bacterium]
MLEIIKVIILGIIEGITEWLPISSTGHMILADEFIKLDVTPEFMEMFLVVIQLGAIFAVVLLFWHKLWPFCNRKSVDKESMSKGNYLMERFIQKDKWILWFKILVSCVPAIIIGLPLDDWLEEHFYNYIVVALMLIIYGVLFIVIENYNKRRKPTIRTLKDITWSTALFIGIFQVLALIPGTSRSGATIIGGILVGCSRKIASEYTFFLAIPVMFGASLLKLVKFGFAFTGWEVLLLVVGMLVAFVVSVFAIKFLMGYIKKHDFKVFGWYRIVLGIIVLIYFLVKTLIA